MTYINISSLILKTCFHIVYYFIILKLLDFFSAGTWTVPFMILFFKKLGLTPSECSIILGSIPLANGVVRLIVGAVTDKLQRHREAVLFFAITSTILNSCMFLVPPAPKQIIENPMVQNLRKMCNDNESHILHCATDQKGEGKVFKLTIDCYVANKTSLVGVPRIPNCVHLADTEKNNYNESHANNVLCKLFCNASDNEVTVIVSEPFGKTFWSLFSIFFTTYNVYFAIWLLLYGTTYAVLGEDRSKFAFCLE